MAKKPPTPDGSEHRSGAPGHGTPRKTHSEEGGAHASEKRTRTYPEDQREAVYDGPNVVTMLHVYGTALAFELPRDRRTFTLGSAPDCDISIPSEHLSAVNNVLERRGPKLRVRDQNSKNGTYYDGVRESDFDLQPGKTFTATPIRFLALSDEMREVYPMLVELLGAEDEHVLRAPDVSWTTPSDVMVAATADDHLLITGEPGCDHGRLARAIHGISRRRGRKIVEVARIPDDRGKQRKILDRAVRSTLVIATDDKTPAMDAAFASMVFSPTYHIRVIVLATSTTQARRVLGSQITKTKEIALQPLARRGAAIPRLINRALEDHGAAFRFGDLSPANQAALAGYDWPGNFDDVRAVTERLVLLDASSYRKAAEALNVSVSTVHDWCKKLGIAIPLRSEPAERVG